MSRRAVFLDKDGTLIPDIPYNVDIRWISLAEHAMEGLRHFKQMGYMIVMVTNQSGIAMGYFLEDRIMAVERKLETLMRAGGVALDGFYYCPHHPDGLINVYAGFCDCRKPAPGMLLKAAREKDIDLSASWMIGDILNDVEAGNRAGCRTILIDNGNETEWKMNTSERIPFGVARNLKEAADIIKTYLHASIV